MPFFIVDCSEEHAVIVTVHRSERWHNFGDVLAEINLTSAAAGIVAYYTQELKVNHIVPNPLLLNDSIFV